MDLPSFIPHCCSEQYCCTSFMIYTAGVWHTRVCTSIVYVWYILHIICQMYGVRTKVRSTPLFRCSSNTGLCWLDDTIHTYVHMYVVHMYHGLFLFLSVFGFPVCSSFPDIFRLYVVPTRAAFSSGDLSCCCASIWYRYYQVLLHMMLYGAGTFGCILQLYCCCTAVNTNM